MTSSQRLCQQQRLLAPRPSPAAQIRTGGRATVFQAPPPLYKRAKNPRRRAAGSSDPASILWSHIIHGLLRPIFQFLEIDRKSWPGLEKAAGSSPAKDQAVTFLKIISEEESESSSQRSNEERVLAETIDSMATKLQTAQAELSKKKHGNQYARDSETMHKISEDTTGHSENLEVTNSKTAFKEEEEFNQSKNEYSIMGGVSVNYQRRMTLLFELLSACVADTPQESNGSPQLKKGYDARLRTALRLLATWLDVEWIKVEAMEIMVACSAMALLKEEGAQTDEIESEDSGWSQWKRSGIIGAAALTGGTLMAITGAAGAGLSGSKMARRTGSVEEFEFKVLGENHNQGRLAVGILVSGFVSEEEDFTRPWEGTNENLESYALQWESKNLIAVSTAIQDWLKSKLTMELMKQGAMMTMLGTLVSALAWPTTLFSALDFIDSKWSIAIDRSDKAGILLAEVLSNNLQGNRPVTLIGFSLGARVIFKCLQQMAESGEEGLVEKVVILGAPISSKGDEWESARKIVAGRFVNVFSTNDWILGVTFRASLLTQGLAGIQAVELPGIENVDASHLIDGHSSYLSAMQTVLQQLELDSYYPVILSAPAESKEVQVE
ncbi:uncharacterized protein A4U43_C08F150 [Asparagus officinalis]|nr:uncharacterized protein A4U43_C08F150 [Asparagus officinalis]